VSTISFGAWAIGGTNWGPTDDEVSKRALHEALDRGVTLIDTADTYGFGHSEELVCEVLRERGKGDVIVASKGGNDFYFSNEKDAQGYGRKMRENYDKDYILFAAEQSLKRLRTDTIDLYQLHSPGNDNVRRDDPWEALAILKRQGKIRYAGLSIQSFRETDQADILDLHHDQLDVIQVRYNLLEREAEKVLFPKALKYGIGVIVRIPLLFGFLTGKFNRDSKFGEDDHRRFNLSAEKMADYLKQLDRMKPLFDRYPGQTLAQVSLRFCISHPACIPPFRGRRPHNKWRITWGLRTTVQSLRRRSLC
jgi:aryl-alcohol dehydrogenase-like predicted oxidoreductase